MTADTIWLVVWNMNCNFPYIGNFIIPTDKLHHFSEGKVYHQPGWILFSFFPAYFRHASLGRKLSLAMRPHGPRRCQGGPVPDMASDGLTER